MPRRKTKHDTERNSIDTHTLLQSVIPAHPDDKTTEKAYAYILDVIIKLRSSIFMTYKTSQRGAEVWMGVGADGKRDGRNRVMWWYDPFGYAREGVGIVNILQNVVAGARISTLVCVFEFWEAVPPRVFACHPVGTDNIAFGIRLESSVTRHLSMAEARKG